jgi:hypothetical protein
MKKLLIPFAGLIMFATACKKENTLPTGNELAPLSVEFDNIVGGTNLYLDSYEYTNAAGEGYKVSLLQYYVSNFKFYKADGTEYIVPQDDSYFLIKESDADSRFAKFNVPEGDYTRLVFTLGVDSLRSTMDISRRTGVLDPSGGMDDGMYWGWNSGYIFFKFEGFSEAAPIDGSGQKKFRYHIGGFGGYNAPTLNNIKELSIDLSTAGEARVRKDRSSNVHLMVDIGKVLSGKNTISIADNPNVMFSEFSVNIADNYKDMFTHDHTEN